MRTGIGRPFTHHPHCPEPLARRLVVHQGGQQLVTVVPLVVVVPVVPLVAAVAAVAAVVVVVAAVVAVVVPLVVVVVQLQHFHRGGVLLPAILLRQL